MIEFSGWRKSSRSGASTDGCVEVASSQDLVGVRDSKDRGGPMLVFQGQAWDAFIRDVRASRYELR